MSDDDTDGDDDNRDEEQFFGVEDFEEEDDDRQMIHDEEAESAMRQVVEGARKDDLRGSLFVRTSDDARFGHEFRSLDELQEHLFEVYNEIWHAVAPVDDGHFVFEPDEWGANERVLDGTGIDEFFAQVRPPQEEHDDVYESKSELTGR